MKSWFLAFMHNASWNAIITPQHTDLTSCFFSGMKHKLYITCLYSAPFQKRPSAHKTPCIVQPPFPAHDPRVLNPSVSIFDNLH